MTRRPKTPPPDDLPDPLRGCMCRVCTGVITVDPAVLEAVPDELAETFEQASFEAAHACGPTWPMADPDAYIRGGLAAVTAEIEQRVRAELSAELMERGSREPVTSGFRRGLRAAATIVAGPPTTEEIVQAIRDGNFVVCDIPDSPREDTGDFQDRGDALRRKYGIDGTAGDAQDVEHPYIPAEQHEYCALCGLAPVHRKHVAGIPADIARGEGR